MELNADAQRRISESLMADRWQTRQIAHPSHPGSKWVLVGPQMRGRLVMLCDLFGASARLSTSAKPCSEDVTPNWRLDARFATAEMILAMARAAESAPGDEPVAWSRHLLNRRLRAIGWTRLTGRIRALFGSTAEWKSPCGTYRLRASVARGNRSRSVDLWGRDAHVSMEATTPVTVVVSLAEVISSRALDAGKDVAR